MRYVQAIKTAAVPPLGLQAASHSHQPSSSVSRVALYLLNPPSHLAMDSFFTIASIVPAEQPESELPMDSESNAHKGNACTIA